MSAPLRDSARAVAGVGHFGIQVADIERSIAFYERLLGLELVARWTRDQEYIQELVGYPGVELHVAVFRLPKTDACLEVLEYKNVQRSPVDPATANPGTAHLCLYVDDLEPVYERLRDAGVDFVSGPKTPTIPPNKGGSVVYMLDPDGIRIELLQTRLTLAGEPRP
jgi:catechol 2,3-dioxygenase-like lactoylglutathione lyase family enzyme